MKAAPRGRGGAVFLGPAAFFHANAALKSGFTLTVTGLAPGSHQIVAYARSTMTGQFEGAPPRRVAVDSAGSVSGR